MTRPQGRHCPKCKGVLAVKGKRKAKGSDVESELLLVCARCGHEEWQKLPVPPPEKEA